MVMALGFICFTDDNVRYNTFYVLEFFSQVFYTYGFALLPWQGARWNETHARGDEYFVAQALLYLLGQFFQVAVVIGKELLQFHFNKHGVVFRRAFERDEVVSSQLGELEQDLLNLDGEYVDSLQNYHVVAAAFHAVKAFVLASAGTFARQDAREVACAVPQQGHGFTTKRGEHQFANLAFGHRLQSFGIDNFNNVVVLPNVHSILLFTFESHSGAAHF